MKKIETSIRVLAMMMQRNEAPKKIEFNGEIFEYVDENINYVDQYGNLLFGDYICNSSDLNRIVTLLLEAKIELFIIHEIDANKIDYYLKDYFNKLKNKKGNNEYHRSKLKTDDCIFKRQLINFLEDKIKEYRDFEKYLYIKEPTKLVEKARIGGCIDVYLEVLDFVNKCDKDEGILYAKIWNKN